MNDLNPILEAMGEIDERTVAEAAKRPKLKKPLRIAIISVAAAMLLGTSAVAATSGENPVFMIDKKRVDGVYSKYVDSDGWTVRTYGVLTPEDGSNYSPVGEVRAVYDRYADQSNDIKIYDELGVEIKDITPSYFWLVKGEKEGETPINSMYSTGSVTSATNWAVSISPDKDEIFINTWFDPIGALKVAAEDAKLARMSIEQKVEYLEATGGSFSTFDDYGGIYHPNAYDFFEFDMRSYCNWKSIAYTVPGTPSAGLKVFDYAPLTGAGLSESEGEVFAVLYIDSENKEFSQGLYQYTLTDDMSGTPVDFTVWRFADRKETYNDHFGIEYETLITANGTEVKLHRSGYSAYIAEFELDGAYVAFKTSLERDGVERILQNLGV